MEMAPQNHDVLILGGGLAGLTLALQILRARPEANVLVAEKSDWPPPIAAHKVGESTVELGTHYLRHVLGLAEYLDAEHLPKLGLRFFFQTTPDAPLHERPEFGAASELPVPSHQVDRGLLEAELARRVQDLGCAFLSGARVSSVELSKHGHTVTLKTPDGEQTEQARWLVDATGRAGMLKRQLKLREPSPHDSNAIWFRVDEDIDIETWDPDPEFAARVPPGLRRLSTNHLMGDGYWVWFIPLSSGSTSVGIVSDPQIHDLKGMSTIDGAMSWLREHEPLAAKAIAPHLDGLQDFHVLRHYSHGAQRVFHPLRWALTGDAGAFLDPFYSPGTDFIALSNTYITDLVCRDLAGERVRSRVNEYNRTYLSMWNAWLPVYERMYETFGVGQVAALKVAWDYSTYWSFQVPTFVNDGFLDVKLMTRTRHLWERITELNRTLQGNLLFWARNEPAPTALRSGLVDSMQVPFLRRFQEQMADRGDLTDLEARLRTNLTVLETLSAEIHRRAAHRLFGTPLDMVVDPLTFSLSALADGEPHRPAAGLPRDPDLAADLDLAWFADRRSG
ncbi:MAG: tryptophan 7-halogenase, partial [Deltaproteobacteria bacterium]|nr:tryptophan 7-halogenase [Deltaproteobacteria bacterium]